MKIESANIWLTLHPSHIDLLTRIVEAYEHLGVVSTIDRQQGLVVVRGTADTSQDLLHILSHLPFDVAINPDAIV